MSGADQMVLEDARNTLQRVVRKLEHRGDHAEAFAAWLLRETQPGFALDNPCRSALERPLAQKNYRDVAVLGFAADAWGASFSHGETLSDRLGWLAGRNPKIGGNPAGFCSDAIALLGIALGAKAVGGRELATRVAAWLDGFVEESFATSRTAPRDQLLAAAALRCVGAKTRLEFAESDDTADLRVVLRVRGLLPSVHRSQGEIEAASALHLVLRATEDVDPLVAAARLAALSDVKDAVRSKALAGFCALSTAIPTDEKPCVAFISYAWEQEQRHNDDVLALANRLREMGIETVIDKYVSGTPEQGWPSWMLQQIKKADFVLVICSERYLRRCERNEAPGVGKGAKWEGAIITQSIYEDDSENRKFIPVVLDPSDLAHIPLMLKSATRYDVGDREQFDNLYRHLTDQPEIVPPPVGRRIELKPRDVRSFRTRS